MSRGITWAITFWGCLLLLSCASRGPRTPQAAYKQLTQAVLQQDAEALFDALDPESRWSWMTIQRSHREAYDVVLSNFPEGEDRESNLRRLEAGALAETPAELFAVRMGTKALAALKDKLPPEPQFTVKNNEADVTGDAGAGALHFRQVEGRWGYAGFAVECEELKRRAIADLELIKTSATDYERARARSTP